MAAKFGEVVGSIVAMTRCCPTTQLCDLSRRLVLPRGLLLPLQQSVIRFWQFDLGVVVM